MKRFFKLFFFKKIRLGDFKTKIGSKNGRLFSGLCRSIYFYLNILSLSSDDKIIASSSGEDFSVNK